ncbi:MAG TPA: R3H domain-containing nucleic acid-binding protein [Thermoanaerobaculia bacterium]
MSHRFEGHNLDEALENASKALNVERYQLAYHVLLEKRGFLGGLKRVVIEADVDHSAQRPAEAPSLVPPASPPQPRQRAERNPRSRGSERSESGGRRRGREGRGSHEHRSGPRHERHRDQPPEREFVASVAPEQGPESSEATDIREWCERLFELSGLEIDVRTEETDEQMRVKLYGRDARQLVAKNGEVLDAAQILASKTFVGRKIEKPIELDTEQFKEHRATELEQRARELADVVRREGREQLLPAMSPVERRIVHLALQGDEEVETISRGDGFYKRVAIVPRHHDEEHVTS